MSLGVCTVDLSGPHEPSPRPGKHIQKDMVQYFLVLTVRPDVATDLQEAQTQTTEQLEQDDLAVGTAPATPAAFNAAPPATGAELPRPLIYAALLSQKSEAADAIKGLLAQVNDDHAGLPHTIIHRLHSDRGTEFVNHELNAYCKLHAILQTTTQGHDPNANATAEAALGTLKRRCRYLLSGARLPTKFWGMGVLAAAQQRSASGGGRCSKNSTPNCWLQSEGVPKRSINC